MSGQGFIAVDDFHEACELCGKVAELRPYGPKGEEVCFECGMLDESNARRGFDRLVGGEPVRELVANESPEMLRTELTAERERAYRAEADAAEAWRQVHLLKAEGGGPDGFATWKDAATDERLRRVKAEAERDALRERVARLVGAIEPVAKVHINRTGGNAGIAWRAIGIDGSLPALADGEVLYVLHTALESVNSLLERKK